jgi:hypothetical protein
MNRNSRRGKVQDQRVKSRRVKELGPPPGWRDRRLSAEKRKPEVEEVSLDEWEALMGISHVQTSSKHPGEPTLTDWEGLKHL